MRLGRGLFAALAALLPLPATAQTAASSSTSQTDAPLGVPAGYVQVWADEFDRPGAPDPKKWAYDTSRNKEGWYNEELQYYAADRPENVRVENGRLILEARNERLADKADFGGQDYASGKLVTSGLADWKYGYIEVRAKLACGRGLWPAISSQIAPWIPWGSRGVGGWRSRISRWTRCWRNSTALRTKSSIAFV